MKDDSSVPSVGRGFVYWKDREQLRVPEGLDKETLQDVRDDLLVRSSLEITYCKKQRGVADDSKGARRKTGSRLPETMFEMSCKRTMDNHGMDASSKAPHGHERHPSSEACADWAALHPKGLDTKEEKPENEAQRLCRFADRPVQPLPRVVGQKPRSTGRGENVVCVLMLLQLKHPSKTRTGERNCIFGQDLF